MTKKLNVEELLAKANEPKKFAMKYHPFYRGKIQIAPKVPVRAFQDFAVWYTPGVAEPCKAIHKNIDAVFEHTNKSNFIAIVSDGTRVLGLGNIGPEAGLPVMEGKALLFKYLGGVDAFPMCLSTKNAEDIITAVKWLTPTFGGINLEDIEKPKCYYILERLREELDIPVWHDDQQGTALVTLAGLINALKITGKKLGEIQTTLIGAGAANINVAKYMILAGAKADNIIMVDSEGILHEGRKDIKETDQVKWEMCKKTNREGRRGGIKEALRDADVFISYSRPGPGAIKKEWVANMADGAIVFAGANPIPEIWPWEAKEAGAKIVATGRSDFPNQVNNSLGFPSVFRGALDVMAKKITDEMCITAAQAIANYAEKKSIWEEYIIPTMDEMEMFVEEAVAVGLKAMQQGIARKKLSRQSLREKVSSKIVEAQKMTRSLMRNRVIAPLPE
ncbi:MAG: NADP-dependent malic enzyme [Candidatus Bathyarchaeota archaeon]|nr:MAG: NADP-dependent malic enzyme [Candidatus Bathyarchaeota archaeon]